MKKTTQRPPRWTVEYGRNTEAPSDTQYWCGIGDGIMDGMFGYGATQEEALKDFIKKLNSDQNYYIVDTSRLS